VGEGRVEEAHGKWPDCVVAAARLSVCGAGGYFKAFAGRVSRRAVQGGHADLGQAESDRIWRSESGKQAVHSEWPKHCHVVWRQMTTFHMNIQGSGVKLHSRLSGLIRLQL